MDLYSEKAPQYDWLVVVMTLASLAVVVDFIWVLSLGDPSAWALLVASMLVIWGTLSLANMRYELTEAGLRAWLWPFRKTVRYADIKQVSLDRIPWWAGMGWHIAGRSTFVNGKYGACLVIEHGENKRRLHITPRDSEDFKRMLDGWMKNTQGKTGKK